MEQSPSWDANRVSASQEKFPHFTGPQGSLPHSQMPATSPYPEPTPSSPYPYNLPPWRSILILPSHLSLGLPNGLFPLGFLNTTLNTPLIFPTRANCPAHLILLDFITRTILGEQYRSLSSSLCSFLHSPVTSSLLDPKYSPQHPILKHPQPTFLPQCQRPRFTPIQNNRQNYSSVYLNFLN